MKLKYITRTLLLSAIAATGITSCDSDADRVYVQTPGDINLDGASAEVILRPDNPQALALTLYWSGDGKLTLDNNLLQAPVNAAVETIQLSKDESFTSPLDLSVEKGVRSRQFLAEELNSLLGRLDFPAEQLSPLYIRIRSVLAANVEPQYSSVIKVMAQSYAIHLTLGTVLDKDWNETTMQFGIARGKRHLHRLHGCERLDELVVPRGQQCGVG